MVVVRDDNGHGFPAASRSIAAFGSFLDLKSLSKCPNYAGKPEDWALWAFKFESWCGLLPDVGATSRMEVLGRAAAASTEGSVDITAFRDEAKTIASGIYLLAQLVSDRVLAIARKTTKGNGLLAWHRLKKEFENLGGHRSVAMLMGLMNPHWGTGMSAKQFVDEIDGWETDLDMYEK